MPSRRCTSARSSFVGSTTARGAHALGEGPAVGVRLADDDVAGAGVAHHRDGHEADGPGPGDQHVLAQDLEAQGRVDGVAEGIEDGRHVLVDAGPVVPDVGHGQGDVLGEGAVPAHAQADAVRAEVAVAGQAVTAASADHVALAADDVAGMEVADVAADLHDLAHELVADHERRPDGPLGPGVPGGDVQVRAADAGLAHLDEDVVDAHGGLRHLGQLQAGAGLRLHEGEHRCLSSADIDLHHPPPRRRMPATLGMRERAESLDRGPNGPPLQPARAEVSPSGRRNGVTAGAIRPCQGLAAAQRLAGQPNRSSHRRHSPWRPDDSSRGHTLVHSRPITARGHRP